MSDAQLIPGTATSRPPKWYRQHEDAAGRWYRAETATGVLWACVSRDQTSSGLLWHVSISHRDRQGNPDRCPTWDEMKSAKYQLVPDDVAMVLIFPRRTDPYVNEYPTCLHLWQSGDSEIGAN